MSYPISINSQWNHRNISRDISDAHLGMGSITIRRCFLLHTSFFNGWSYMKWTLSPQSSKGIFVTELGHKVNISFYLVTDHTLWGSSILKLITGRSAKSATGDRALCRRYDSHLAMYYSSGWAPSDSVFPPLLWVMPWGSLHSSSRCACVGDIAKSTPQMPFLSIAGTEAHSE